MSGLFEVIVQALEQAAQSVHKGKRGTCSVSGCPNDAVAKGLCNAHYLRSSRGQSLHQPVQASHSGSCTQCQAPINNKGGWGLCAKHYKSARFKVVKQAAVAALGGKCSQCQIEYPLAVYDFHHQSDKAHTPSQLISNKNIKTIATELEKCVLLCANCHRMEHHEDKL